MIFGREGAVVWWQMCSRALLVFVVGIALLRAGGLRILGMHTAFDLLVTVILGSALGRIVTGDAPIFGGMAAAATIVAGHRLFAAVTTWSHRFGIMVKGRERALVRDGVLDHAAMNATHISEHDLRAAIRLRAGIDDIARVQLAQLERTGEISVLAKALDSPARG